MKTAALAPIDRQAVSGVVTVRRSSARYLAEIVRNPLTALPAACYEERIVLSRNLGRQRAYICDPALIQEVFVRDADKLVKSAEMKRVLGVAIGEGLLTADGADWRWQRQALAPAFRPDNVAALLPAMIAAAEATRDAWRALPQGATIDVGHEMMRTTYRIILDTMLSGSAGLDAARVERGVSDFLGATSWMFALAILRAPRSLPFPGRRRSEEATRFMRRTVLDRIAERRVAGAQTGDLIDMLIAAADPETGRVLTDEEIVDNLLTFIAAGHETTAAALGWTFALLAAHPDQAARMHAEIDAATGEGPVLPQHIEGLAFTRQVVSEAMRLYPPAPMIVRSIERDIEVAGVTLTKGSVVFAPIHAVHRHKSLWSRPDAFDPDRFAPEAVKGRHRLAYLPFGVGPRICIGATFAITEAVAILAVLAKSMRLDLVDRVLPEPMMRVTLRPARPLHMRVAARSGQ